MSAGTLYIVGTPIGNLEDMSPRAVRILKEVDLIAAEDTRHSIKLLNHFYINTPMESYHKFSEKSKTAKIIQFLKNGKNIALISDAGMPGISDPGQILIKDAINNNINVIPVPGPSACILALAASGFSTDRFCFEGFLPREKSLKLQRLFSLKDETRTMLFYEAGPRIKETLQEMKKIFGNRLCAVARELTKKFEDVKRGYLDDIITSINTIKGEFVIVLEGSTQQQHSTDISLKEEIENLQKQLNISAKEAIKLAAVKLNMPKREVYGEWIRKNKN